MISPANISFQLVESYFTCQLGLPTCQEILRLQKSREVLHMPASYANFSRVTSPAHFLCYFACQLLTPIFRELFYLPASPANFSRNALPASLLPRHSSSSFPPAGFYERVLFFLLVAQNKHHKWVPPPQKQIAPISS